MNYNCLMKKSIYTILAVATILAFGLFFAFPNKGLALIGGSSPFGGRVSARIPCTCGADSLIFVGPPVGGQFILSPASRVYKNYGVFPPNWVLGLASGFSTCLVLVPSIPPTCVPSGNGPIIKIMGTS